MHFHLLATAAVSIVAAAAQTAVSQSVFDDIVRYTRYAGASYADKCPSPPFGSSLVKFFNGTATETQAVLYRDISRGELILAFRGTSTPPDYDTDLLFSLVNVTLAGVTCSGCMVHDGFQDSVNSVAPDISATVRNTLSSNPASKLIVVGHSLGGALASLAAVSLVSQGTPVAAVYTYGEPRNGNPALSTYVDSRIPPSNYFRVTHANDGVPKIPNTILGFAHHGTEYWQQPISGISAITTLNCGTGEPQQCAQAQTADGQPINGAHISYSNFIVGATLFNPSCGFSEP